MSTNEMQTRMTAAALAHRACCGTEHDPANGKLHGCCVVCGVPWPCETAKTFLFTKAETTDPAPATSEDDHVPTTNTNRTRDSDHYCGVHQRLMHLLRSIRAFDAQHINDRGQT